MRCNVWTSFAAVACLIAGTPQAWAADALGTAGPIRSFGFTRCSADYQSRLRGACDPPEVSSDLAPTSRSTARVSRARELIGLGKVDRAISELDSAIVEDSNNIGAYVLRARLAIPTHSSDGTRYLHRALEIDPKHAGALATLAFIQRGTNPKQAMQIADDAVRSDPKNADARWIRSLIFSDLDRLDDAERDLTVAIDLEPDELRSRLSRAHLLMKTGRVAGALDDANVILTKRLDPSAIHIRATARILDGEYALAAEDLSRLLGAPGNPGTVPVGQKQFLNMLVQRALTFVRTGKDGDALRDLEAIVKFGGLRGILQLQIFLRANGFPDVPLDGKASQLFEDALKSCFISDACSRGIAIRT